MRLIDAESPQNRIYVSGLVIEEMKKIPTVDIDRPASSQLERMAVRCEECAYHEDEEPGMVYCPRILGGWVPNEFFCGDGKRRTNANEPNGA